MFIESDKSRCVISTNDSILSEGDKGFSAEQFVQNLLNEGPNVPCDETQESFRNQRLPLFYDEELYKKGQTFFYKHIFALFLSKFLGLITVLSQLSTLKILIMTNMSSSDMTAYRRYMSTIFHMCVWYEDDFKPSSRLWKSLEIVRNRHNSSSKTAHSVLGYRINQRDMALTQFGFMGYAVARSEMIGIHCATDEELKGFIHIWRVVGYILGIEDRFNICRESVEETRAICNMIMDRALKPDFELAKQEKDFIEMSSYLVNGLWTMMPALEYNVFLFYLQLVLENNTSSLNKNNSCYKMLNSREQSKVKFVVYVVRSLRFFIFRYFLNYIQMFDLWLMKVFPFLAYYKFGKENSHIRIF